MSFSLKGISLSGCHITARTLSLYLNDSMFLSLSMAKGSIVEGRSFWLIEKL